MSRRIQSVIIFQMLTYMQATAARNAQKHFGIGETLSVFLYIST